jgi:small subunit ribosomal protein S1
MAENETNHNHAENPPPAAEGSRIAPLRTRHPMATLLRNGGSAFPRPGEIIEGAVIEKKHGALFVDLGIKGIGIVYGREYKAAEDIIKNLAPDDTVHAKIVELDNEDGYVELSLKEAGEEKRWVILKNMRDTEEAMELVVREANRGGLILELEGVKGFLPASQLSIKNYPRVEGGDKERIFQELQKLVGRPLRVKVIDLDPREQKLIFSEKGIASDATRAALAKYKTGDVIEGEVTGVVDFGAFVRFDENLEGLIHISEIDWTLIEDPRSVLKPGDPVKAKIIDIQGDKIALSLKALKDDPWVKIAEQYHKGDTVLGKITRFAPFGAFAEIEPHTHPVAGQLPEAADATPLAEPASNRIQGLVHISEFGNQARMQNELKIGETYDLKIILLDPKEHRMSLGMARGAQQTESLLPESAPESLSSHQPTIEAKPL